MLEERFVLFFCLLFFSLTVKLFLHPLDLVSPFFFPQCALTLSSSHLHYASSVTCFLCSLLPFRTMLRLTPPSCGAKLTLPVWRASGRGQSMWYRCGHGLWPALANTAARCASKPSQMVSMAVPGETALCLSLLLCLSHTQTPFSLFSHHSCPSLCLLLRYYSSEIIERNCNV